MPAFLDNVGLIILIVGLCLFFIAFCGCCGGIKENKCLLIIVSITVYTFQHSIHSIQIVLFLGGGGGSSTTYTEVLCTTSVQRIWVRTHDRHGQIMTVSTFHVTETPALATWPSVTSGKEYTATFSQRSEVIQMHGISFVKIKLFYFIAHEIGLGRAK